MAQGDNAALALKAVGQAVNKVVLCAHDKGGAGRFGSHAGRVLDEKGCGTRAVADSDDLFAAFGMRNDAAAGVRGAHFAHVVRVKAGVDGAAARP